MEIENGIFAVLFGICHWNGQCMAFSLSLLSQRRRRIFAAVFIDVAAVWHSTVLHGNVLGPILKYWLSNHVPCVTLVQRSDCIYLRARSIGTYQLFLSICRCWLRHHCGECHLYHLLQHNHRLSDRIHCQVDGQHIALDALRPWMEHTVLFGNYAHRRQCNIHWAQSLRIGVESFAVQNASRRILSVGIPQPLPFDRRMKCVRYRHSNSNFMDKQPRNTRNHRQHWRDRWHRLAIVLFEYRRLDGHLFVHHQGS